MELWIATIGAYAEERIVGIAATEDGAQELINKLRTTPGHHDMDDCVRGPYALGEAYNWRHEVI